MHPPSPANRVRFNLLSEILFVRATRVLSPSLIRLEFQSLERDSVCSSLAPTPAAGGFGGRFNLLSEILFVQANTIKYYRLLMYQFQSLERDSVCSSNFDVYASLTNP